MPSWQTEQLAPLFERIRRDPELRDNTLIVFCSDNGPETGAGSAGGLRGGKTWLYEGGIRSPLIVWGPGLMAPQSAGSTNDQSVYCALDLNRSIYTLTKTHLPEGAVLDGEDLVGTILGTSTEGRKSPIFYRRPPDRPGFSQGDEDQDNPDLAAIEGNWKYLVNLDGSAPQLYDLATDPEESKNLANTQPKITERLRESVISWNTTLPKDAGDPAFQAGPMPKGPKGGKAKGQ